MEEYLTMIPVMNYMSFVAHHSAAVVPSAISANHFVCATKAIIKPFDK